MEETFCCSCWKGGLDQPCGSLELADTGAKRYNSTILVLLKYGTSCNTSKTTLTSPHSLHALSLFTLAKWTLVLNSYIKWQYISAMCSSNKILQRKLLKHIIIIQIQLHALHSFCIENWPYLPCSVWDYIAATHYITYSPHTSACTAYPHYQSHCLHSPAMHTTKKRKA